MLSVIMLSVIMLSVIMLSVIRLSGITLSVIMLIIIMLIIVFYQVQCALFYIENDAEKFPAHYTFKVVEKGFKMAFMMNKLAMINSCEIILEK